MDIAFEWEDLPAALGIGLRGGCGAALLVVIEKDIVLPAEEGSSSSNNDQRK